MSKNIIIGEDCNISDLLSGVKTDDIDRDDPNYVRKFQDSISRVSCIMGCNRHDSIRMDGEISFEDYKKYCFQYVPNNVFRREVQRTWNVFIIGNEVDAENTIKEELKSATHFRRMVLEQALKELQYVRAMSIL